MLTIFISYLQLFANLEIAEKSVFFFFEQIYILIKVFLQLILGDTMTVSQPTVSRIVFRVSVLLASKIHDYIKMPRTQAAKLENQRLFERLGYGNGAIGIPGVDGAIDCTHIRLVHTRFQNINEIYRNRKGYFSLNVQVSIAFISTSHYRLKNL